MLEFISTTSSDGLIFQGARATNGTNESVIIDIHGLSWDFYSTSFYRYFYKNISEAGVDFIAGDTRAAYKMRLFSKTDGSYYAGGGAYEVFEDCVLDIEAWIIKAKELGYKHIFLSGYSLGPTKIAYYFSQASSSDLSGLIFFSPSDMHGLAHEPTEAARHARLLAEAKQLVSDNQPLGLLSEKLWDVEVFSANTYLSLFDNPNARVFNYFAPELGFEILHKINVPVLSFTGTKDEGLIYCSPIEKAMVLLEVGLVNSPSKDLHVLEGAEHSFDNFEAELMTKTVEFVNKVTKPTS